MLESPDVHSLSSHPSSQTRFAENKTQQVHSGSNTVYPQAEAPTTANVTLHANEKLCLPNRATAAAAEMCKVSRTHTIIHLF